VRLSEEYLFLFLSAAASVLCLESGTSRARMTEPVCRLRCVVCGRFEGRRQVFRMAVCQAVVVARRRLVQENTVVLMWTRWTMSASGPAHLSGCCCCCCGGSESFPLDDGEISNIVVTMVVTMGTVKISLCR